MSFEKPKLFTNPRIVAFIDTSKCRTTMRYSFRQLRLRAANMKTTLTGSNFTLINRDFSLRITAKVTKSIRVYIRNIDVVIVKRQVIVNNIPYIIFSKCNCIE